MSEYGYLEIVPKDVIDHLGEEVAVKAAYLQAALGAIRSNKWNGNSLEFHKTTSVGGNITIGVKFNEQPEVQQD